MELPENLNHLFALQNSLEAGNTGVMFRSVLILEEHAMTILSFQALCLPACFFTMLARVQLGQCSL